MYFLGHEIDEKRTLKVIVIKMMEYFFWAFVSLLC
jgi:hypothetical protein